MKKLFNLWKSTYTGKVYELPADYMPSVMYGGWEIIGTIEKEVG